MARLIQTPQIAGIGETLLEEPEGAAPNLAVVVCHPHPLHGGTMHNKVVYRMARGLRSTGAVVLRFDFRKTGVIEEGVEDARVALEWLRARYPDLPWAIAGFSFGSRVAMRLGCEQPGAQFILAAGFPTRWGTPEHLEACTVPKIFVQSTNDQYAPRAEFEVMYAGFAEPKQVHWVTADDHFFVGGLDACELTIGRSAAHARTPAPAEDDRGYR
jgi:alpha/beta superfamily hydrolase